MKDDGTYSIRVIPIGNSWKEARSIAVEVDLVINGVERRFEGRINEV